MNHQRGPIEPLAKWRFAPVMGRFVDANDLLRAQFLFITFGKHASNGRSDYRGHLVNIKFRRLAGNLPNVSSAVCFVAASCRIDVLPL